MKRYLSIVGILIQFATAEDLSIVLQTISGGATVESIPITLHQGDTAKLEFAGGESWDFWMRCTADGKTNDLRCLKPETTGPPKETNPVTVAGPATIVFRAWGDTNISPPSATPGPARPALPLPFRRRREPNGM